MRQFVSAWLLLPLVAACTEAGGREFATAVRDSAGVAIIENRGVASLASLGWRVEETPLVEIGPDESGTAGALYQVTGAFRLNDGRIVVANHGAQELRIYSPEGELLRQVGREGAGPGEFTSVFWVGSLPGDSIAAWDALSGRLSVFTPGGDFVRSVTPAGSLGLLPQAVGVLSDGRVVVATGAGSGGVLPSEGHAVRDTVTYVVLSPDGAVVDTLGRFPGTEMVAIGNPRGGYLIRPLPFGRGTRAAVDGGRVYVGTADSYEVAAYEPEKGLQSIIRADRKPAPVTKTDIRDYARTLVTLGGEGQAGVNHQLTELLERVPYPKTMPAYTDLKTDRSGNLWVQEPSKPGDTQGPLWTVISPDGRVHGTVRMPPDFRVHQIGADWVLGLVLDEDQAEHLRLYRLSKPKPPTEA